jgi:hypothetical protein
MAELPCPKCKKKIAHDATVCPFCQSAFDAETISKRAALTKSQNKSAGLGCLIIIIILVSIGFFTSQPNSPTDAKAAMAAYYKGIMPPLNACQTASALAIENFQMVVKGKITAFSAYEAVSKTEGVCDQAQSTIATLVKPTGLPDEAQKNFDQNSSSCFSSVKGRTEAIGLILKALDGGLKPSLVNELGVMGEGVQADSIRCAAALGGTAAAVGLKPEELK